MLAFLHPAQDWLARNPLMIPSSLAALGGLISVGFAALQIRWAARIRDEEVKVKQAQFILNVNEQLHRFSRVRQYIRQGDMPDPMIDAETFVLLRDYSAIFETLYNISKAKLITPENLSRHFGYRFSELDREPNFHKLLETEDEFKDLSRAFRHFRRIVAEHPAD